MAMSNIEIIKEMYQLFRTDDKDGLRKLFCPQVEWNQMEGFPAGGRYIGIEAVFQSVFTRLKEEWLEWKADTERYMEAENTVIVLGYYYGTYIKTNKSFKAAFSHFYTIEGSKIIRFQQYTDTYKIVQVMEDHSNAL